MLPRCRGHRNAWDRGSPYSDEFKQRAVRLAAEMGMTAAQAADDLGRSAQAIRDWRRQSEIDAGERDGISSDERARLQAENVELKRRNKQLEQERGTLKRAVA